MIEQCVNGETFKSVSATVDAFRVTVSDDLRSQFVTSRMLLGAACYAGVFK